MARLCRLMRAPVLIPLLIGLAALFTIGACNTVESDVEASVLSALDTAGLDQIALDDVAYRNVVLRGPDALESEAVAVAGALAATQDVAYVGTGPQPQATPVPEPAASTAATVPTPATVNVTGNIADGRITLQGSVPDEGTRAALVAASEAAFGEPNTTDDLSVDDREPGPELSRAASDLASLIELLPDQLRSGQFRLAGTELTLRGEATSPAAVQELESAIRALANLEGQAEVGATRRATLEFTAAITETGVRLTGTVPDESTRTRLVAAAGAAVGPGGVEDELTVEGVDPDEDLMAAADDVATLIELLPPMLERGELRMRGTTVGIRGVAASLEDLGRLDAAIESAGSIRVRTIVDSAEAAVPEIDQIVALETITFDSGSAQLTYDGSAVLDRVAVILIDAFAADPDLRIEVAGHTDDRGAESANLALSQARADTVRDYLVARGVEASRLVAVGYGEAQPVADNGTTAGREQNRRIEFVEG